MEGQESYAITGHILVPYHYKLSEEEKQHLLEQYNISLTQLPKIKANDPVLASLEVQPGDVIKIIRKSPIIGETAFYRVVING